MNLFDSAGDAGLEFDLDPPWLGVLVGDDQSDVADERFAGIVSSSYSILTVIALLISSRVGQSTAIPDLQPEKKPVGGVTSAVDLVYLSRPPTESRQNSLAPPSTAENSGRCTHDSQSLHPSETGVCSFSPSEVAETHREEHGAISQRTQSGSTNREDRQAEEIDSSEA